MKLDVILNKNNLDSEKYHDFPFVCGCIIICMCLCIYTHIHIAHKITEGTIWSKNGLVERRQERVK